MLSKKKRGRLTAEVNKPERVQIANVTGFLGFLVSMATTQLDCAIRKQLQAMCKQIGMCHVFYPVPFRGCNKHPGQEKLRRRKGLSGLYFSPSPSLREVRMETPAGTIIPQSVTYRGSHRRNPSRNMEDAACCLSGRYAQLAF